MRFLHPKWNRQLLAVSLVGFSLNGSPIRADETLNRMVVTAEDIDLAKIQSGGQVVFVSSGQRAAASHAIDGDRRTVFLFSISDPRPTLIVKLTESKPVHRVSVVVGSQAGEVNVYLLDEIPRDPSDLDKVKPVASITDFEVGREAVADFAPKNARYIALRWALSKNYSHPMAVAEVSVFSNATDPTLATLAASDPPPADPIQAPPIIVSVSP
ncbi:MAG TPA: hypothetical protein VNW72_03770 [Chthoniobacterales bacterium]|jgi:hypothetical protein|nr:hypothetical protein [Chthoniobacterales bacterium]